MENWKRQHGTKQYPCRTPFERCYGWAKLIEFGKKERAVTSTSNQAVPKVDDSRYSRLV
jgi:hypothetical protein